jgi:hypothetical protein
VFISCDYLCSLYLSFSFSDQMMHIRCIQKYLTLNEAIKEKYYHLKKGNKEALMFLPFCPLFPHFYLATLNCFLINFTITFTKIKQVKKLYERMCLLFIVSNPVPSSTGLNPCHCWLFLILPRTESQQLTVSCHMFHDQSSSEKETEAEEM